MGGGSGRYHNIAAMAIWRRRVFEFVIGGILDIDIVESVSMCCLYALSCPLNRYWPVRYVATNHFEPLWCERTGCIARTSVDAKNGVASLALLFFTRRRSSRDFVSVVWVLATRKIKAENEILR